MATSTREMKRQHRHRRVRALVSGTPERPRLSVYKSNTRIVAQVIDDTRGSTIAAVSSDSQKGKTPQERIVGAAEALAKEAQGKGVKKVVFDRGGFQYIGSIKVFAESARKAGLDF